MNIKSIIFFCACLAAVPAFAQDTPTPTPTDTPTPTATPNTCPNGDASYLSCVTACGTADPGCAPQGSVDAYVSFLQTSLASCSYPGLTTPDQLNGLKQIIQGLIKTGALSRSATGNLMHEINACRKLLHHGGGQGHGHGHGGGNDNGGNG